MTLEYDGGTLAGHDAAGTDHALEVVGRRLGGEFEIDGFAFDGPEAAEQISSTASRSTTLRGARHSMCAGGPGSGSV